MSEIDTPVETPVVPDEGAPRTFTQEEVNRINAADRRKDRERLAELEQLVESLKPKAAKADELEAAQLTAAERAEREAEEWRTKYADLESQVKTSQRKEAATAAALKVAKELGIAPDAALVFADRLRGDDADAMEADARDVLAHLKPGTPAAPPAANDALTEVTPEQFAKMSYKERVDLYTRDPQTYAKLAGVAPK